MFSFLIHTHTDCRDIWPMFFGQLEKYFPDNFKSIVVNDSPESIKNYNICIYNKNKPYTTRFNKILSDLEDNIILFTHEDMIIYDEPNKEVISEYCDLIKKDNADFIKLLKCSYDPHKKNFSVSTENRNLTLSPVEFSFTIQPTLCKANKLLELFNSAPPTDIWSFESQIPSIFENFKYNKCFMSSIANEPKRGTYHWDSTIYPHGNMIYKGKWVNEYKKELESLAKNYKINLSERGFSAF